MHIAQCSVHTTHCEWERRADSEKEIWDDSHPDVAVNKDGGTFRETLKLSFLENSPLSKILNLKTMPFCQVITVTPIINTLYCSLVHFDLPIHFWENKCQKSTHILFWQEHKLSSKRYLKNYLKKIMDRTSKKFQCGKENFNI